MQRKNKRKSNNDNRKQNGNTQRTENGLTPKELMFCEEYLKSFNKAKSARMAGYNDNNSWEKGWVVFKLPHVQDYINEKLKERYARLKMEQDDVVKWYYKVATFDISQLYDEKHDFIGLENLAPEQKFMIKSISKSKKPTKTGAVIETLHVTLHDQEKAWEKLAMHLGMSSGNFNMYEKKTIEMNIKVEELKKLGTEKLHRLKELLQPKPN